MALMLVGAAAAFVIARKQQVITKTTAHEKKSEEVNEGDRRGSIYPRFDSNPRLLGVKNESIANQMQAPGLSRWGFGAPGLQGRGELQPNKRQRMAARYHDYLKDTPLIDPVADQGGRPGSILPSAAQTMGRSHRLRTLGGGGGSHTF